jgi:hypothetical protein
VDRQNDQGPYLEILPSFHPTYAQQEGKTRGSLQEANHGAIQVFEVHKCNIRWIVLSSGGHTPLTSSLMVGQSYQLLLSSQLYSVHPLYLST